MWIFTNRKMTRKSINIINTTAEITNITVEISFRGRFGINIGGINTGVTIINIIASIILLLVANIILFVFLFSFVFVFFGRLCWVYCRCRLFSPP